MIPVCEPVVGDREIELVTECLRSGWISSAGEQLARFEAGWAERCGVRHAVAVSSGTAALHLAVAALRLEPGDEVILPTLTIISCANAIVQCGGTPVLVDSEPGTWCMDVDAVASRIGPRTRAIMAVHLYGHPVDMDPLRRLAERHGLALIEDAAEAHGARYLCGRTGSDPEWRECGGLGDVSTFSFYANKLVTTGEGGMVLTSDDDLASRVRNLRNLCFGGERRFEHREMGFNYRMTNLQAAIGVAQLERLDATVVAKRRLATAYRERFEAEPRLELQVERSWASSVYWMFGLVLADELEMDAATFASALRERGVDTRPFFLGMHEQPVFRDGGLFRGERFRIAERLARRGLYLPSGSGLTDQQIDRVCDAVRGALG
jgi:perosamine synthetase